MTYYVFGFFDDERRVWSLGPFTMEDAEDIMWSLAGDRIECWMGD